MDMYNTKNEKNYTDDIYSRSAEKMGKENDKQRKTEGKIETENKESVCHLSFSHAKEKTLRSARSTVGRNPYRVDRDTHQQIFFAESCIFVCFRKCNK